VGARRSLLSVYRRLRAHFGPAGWWPAETPFEVCVGAILVQNTAWGNAERALAALRAEGLLDFAALRRVRRVRLERLIRSSGCYRVKARRLRAFLEFLHERFGGRVEAMAAEDPLRLREALLEVRGIGRETADSIVLYAAGLPLFVIDAYTRRVFARLGLVRGHEPYDDLQRFFTERLPKRATLFNDFHAQIVTLAKDICRPRPRCDVCPLGSGLGLAHLLPSGARSCVREERPRAAPRAQGGSGRAAVPDRLRH
jgi:endonuclease-3 related protein